MTTLEQINALLPPEEQNRLLLSGALAALARYSCFSAAWSNHQELLAKELSGELTLPDRLLDSVPNDGYSWLADELWDVRESLFEAAWGDSGEEWLAAIIGPVELDEYQAEQLESAIEFLFETEDSLPAWSARKVPPRQNIADFIADWRWELIRRLSRRIPLERSSSAPPPQ